MRRASKHPYVSCVIPAYNGAAFLPEAVESALHQDFPESEREIIVVDDASTDGTPGVLRRYAGKIRVLRHAVNRGQGEALRTAVRAARGEIIAALDADDVWLPRKLASVAMAFERARDVNVVCHQMRLGDDRLNPISIAGGAPNDIPGDRCVRFGRESILLRSRGKEIKGILFCCGGGSWAVRKEAVVGKLDTCEPPRAYVDMFFTFLAASSGGRGLRLKEKLGVYRRHQGSHDFFEAGDIERHMRSWRRCGDCVERIFQAAPSPLDPVWAADLEAIRAHAAAIILLLEAHRLDPGRHRPHRREIS